MNDIQDILANEENPDTLREHATRVLAEGGDMTDVINLRRKATRIICALEREGKWEHRAPTPMPEPALALATPTIPAAPETHPSLVVAETSPLATTEAPPPPEATADGARILGHVNEAIANENRPEILHNMADDLHDLGLFPGAVTALRTKAEAASAALDAHEVRQFGEQQVTAENGQAPEPKPT